MILFAPIWANVLPARIEGSVAATPHDLQAVAVKLYFVDPLQPLWQLGYRETIHRFNEARGLLGQGTLLCHGPSLMPRLRSLGMAIHVFQGNPMLDESLEDLRSHAAKSTLWGRLLATLCEVGNNHGQHDA